MKAGFKRDSIRVFKGETGGRDWTAIWFTLVLDLSEEFGEDCYIEIRDCMASRTKEGNPYVRTPEKKFNTKSGEQKSLLAYVNGGPLRKLLNDVLTTPEFGS